MVTVSKRVSKDKVCRIQELVKLLDLKSFRFIHFYESFNDIYFMEYECESNDLYRLNNFLYESEKEPWSKWKKLWFKIKGVFSGN